MFTYFESMCFFNCNLEFSSFSAVITFTKYCPCAQMYVDKLAHKITRQEMRLNVQARLVG